MHLKGGNGTGKSTLLATIAGLLNPNRGSISIADRSFSYLPAENCGHFLKLDAVSNLNFWANVYGQPASLPEISAALHDWGLGKTAARKGFPVEHFSTGMKRRLALARLQVLNTNLWLLDEPVIGLDANAQSQCQVFFERHLANGGMIVMVSHETDSFAQIDHQTLSLE